MPTARAPRKTGSRRSSSGPRATAVYQASASGLPPEVVQNLQQTLRTSVLRYFERHGRLAPIDERTVAYVLRKPTHDGRTCLFMDPLEAMARLAALIPPPRGPPCQVPQNVWGCLRCFGVLAPNATLREQVVQTAGPSSALLERPEQAAKCMGIGWGGRGWVMCASVSGVAVGWWRF